MGVQFRRGIDPGPYNLHTDAPLVMFAEEDLPIPQGICFGINVFIRLSDHSAAQGATRLVRGSHTLGRLPNASFDPALVGKEGVAVGRDPSSGADASMVAERERLVAEDVPPLIAAGGRTGSVLMFRSEAWVRGDAFSL